ALTPTSTTAIYPLSLHDALPISDHRHRLVRKIIYILCKQCADFRRVLHYEYAGIVADIVISVADYESAPFLQYVRYEILTVDQMAFYCHKNTITINFA